MVKLSLKQALEARSVERCRGSQIFYTIGSQMVVRLSKAILKQATVAHRVVRHQGPHIFQTIGSQMGVRMSALRAGRPLPPGKFLVLISVRG
jgi:hypothetical protein